MIFLALFIAVLIWSYSSLAQRVQQDVWWFWWQKKIPTGLPVPVVVLLSVILPAVLVAVLIDQLEHIAFGILALPILIVVVIYGLGRGDMRKDWNHYVEELQHGDYEAAFQQSVKMSVLDAETPVETPFDLHQYMRKAFCYYGLERCFAPVFWFVLLGPGAIIAYRLLVMASQQSVEMRRFLQWAEWLPARLLALSFALAANFSTGFQRFQEMLVAEKSLQDVVGDCAIAALELPVSAEHYASNENLFSAAAREMVAVKSLMKRSYILWLVVIGFMLLI
jgi:AmpE protein